ncbi:MAG: fibrillarin-like rRNA/tRNA 2'-O-methyltransferase [Candidatus Diapherotrites archaeon]
MKEIFPGIYLINGKLATLNSVPGNKVYGEQLVSVKDQEFRIWDPYRSKLAAAIKKNLKTVPLKKDFKVLYLGSAEGTTVSHVAESVGDKGLVFGVEFSERTMRKFIDICESRSNIIPILADANKPDSYSEYLEGQGIDLLYQDIAQKNQAEIFNKNAKMFLKKGSFGMIAIKARSISQKKNIKEIFDTEIAEIEKEFKIIESVPLAPFEKEHLFVVCQKK